MKQPAQYWSANYGKQIHTTYFFDLERTAQGENSFST